MSRPDPSEGREFLPPPEESSRRPFMWLRWLVTGRDGDALSVADRLPMRDRLERLGVVAVRQSEWRNASIAVLEQDLNELQFLLGTIRRGDFLDHFRSLAPNDGRYTNDEMLLSLARLWLADNSGVADDLVDAGNLTRDHLKYFTDAEVVEFSEAYQAILNSLRDTLDCA